MNAHELMNGINLKQDKAHSMTFARFNHSGLSTGCNPLLRKQEQLRENDDAKFLEWANQESEEQNNGKEPNEHHPGYQLVGDNLDIKVTARQATSKYQGSDYHIPLRTHEYSTMIIKSTYTLLAPS